MSQDQQPGATPPDERTILVPTPGRRRGADATIAADATIVAGQPAPGDAAPISELAPVVAPVPDLAPLAAAPSARAGVNALVGAANALLDLVVPLRIMAAHPNVEGLRLQLVDAIKRFEADARAAAVAPEAVAAARYCLCTFLDETISSTPWGGGGVWASHSLLVAFHNEVSGGERFFLILQKLCQAPRANLDALELMYLCLALGMEGRYRVLDNGRAQLDTVRERLQQLIRKERGPVEAGLSPHWQGAAAPGANLLRGMPAWGVAAAAVLLLVLLQLGLHFLLERRAEPVLALLERSRLGLPQPQLLQRPPPQRVIPFLAREIEQGLVSVTETAQSATIVLHGDAAFASGSARVLASYDPLLDRIGAALAALSGEVRVIGHADDQAPRGGRSNLELSRLRAESVAALLAKRAGPPSRYQAEGRGASEPVAPNDSAANRARNRRVVIIALAPEQP